MATVTFYEKPGCGTNARQKLALSNAGHTLEVRSLLAEPWTAERLRGFFGDTPVAAWFNPAAPKVKSGAVDPSAVGAEAAIALMLAEPLLIRRPLVETDSGRCAGFDREPVLSLLGPSDPGARPLTRSLEGCSSPHAPCPDPAERKAS
ncbi:ArsC/Spx/MgsR family protein [Xanthobacter oligotrophicus]|uniref:ArsC/Spx/MgsR family protein n=1 Tax=Xanthobacter oligotrophicus TaxID=2607286 RepID=UPI0011F2E80F|nr:ArsC/Spx/MgsR family protein [Xanthobacter oligotrophicus]MCG5235228.1 arsenate reductase family protein [Xanthobacter oligotrophicus]